MTSSTDETIAIDIQPERRYFQHEWGALPDEQRQRWLSMEFYTVVAPKLGDDGEVETPGMLKVTWFNGEDRFIGANGAAPIEEVIKATAAQEWDEKTGTWPASFPRIGAMDMESGRFCTGIDFGKMKAQWTMPVAAGVISSRWEPIEIEAD